MMISNLIDFKSFLIKEAAKSYSDLKNVILLTLQSKGSVRMALYDYVLSESVGYLQAVKPGTQQFWEVERINAEKGYGPLMYDILMMLVYPSGIKPGSLIKPAALSVYDYYQKSRPDVKKTMLDSSNPAYVEIYRNDTEGPSKSDQRSLELINCLYYLKPTSEFQNLIKESDKISSEMSLDAKKILKRAENQFIELYYSLV